jgi:hypothetical protein
MSAPVLEQVKTSFNCKTAGSELKGSSPFHHFISVQCSVINGSMSTSGGPFKDDIYFAAQFHFHWGSKDRGGSEHTVLGKHYQAEVSNQKVPYYLGWVVQNCVDTILALTQLDLTEGTQVGEKNSF